VLLALGSAELAPPAAAEQAGLARGASASERQARAAYARLPLSFVANAGQLDPRVRYSAQAGGASVSFTKREAVLAFAKQERGLALGLTFLGANRAVALHGRARGAGRVNYLRGRDPAGWHTNLPTYRQVVYRRLWPGIDLVFGGADGRLKYEFHVAPGASVGEIGLAYRGARGLALDGEGNLRIETALGVLTDTRPVSHQTIGDRRVAVASRFVLRGQRGYRFALGTYDRSRPLVIDPGLVYSTFLGGSFVDRGFGITLDGAGSAYVTGDAGSPDFPATAGSFSPTYNGGASDAFVTKLNPAGSALVYSTFLVGAAATAAPGSLWTAPGAPT
jgi:hypothetical protein